ncbi:MAG: response regulator, partial [Anaerolineae bacterium]
MSVQPKDATILVVEDNFQNFVLITRLLAYLGVKKCEWKASGWQVLEFAESLPNIDLILMDIFLPEEDGYQILERLRAHPRFKDTLIVAVTADVSMDNMERAREAGFDGFIGKPLN